jgi:arginase
MPITLIEVPYYGGRKAVGPALGVVRLAEAHPVLPRESVDRTGSLVNELDALVEISRALAGRIREAVEGAGFPLVLGANCYTCLGVLAGLNNPGVGVIWFDAHGDFNTPSTSPSGYLDGMPLAIAAGLCYPEVLVQIGGVPISEARIVHVGARALDPGELDLLQNSPVSVAAMEAIRREGLEGALAPALNALRRQTREVYLHLDFDVIDPQEAPGVLFPEPGGLSLAEVEEAVRLVKERFEVRAASLIGYHPAVDHHDRTFRLGLRLVDVIGGLIS